VRIFGGDAWTGCAAATARGAWQHPRGGLVVDCEGCDYVAETGCQLLGIGRDWNVSDASHFHRVQEGQFLYSAELRSVLMSTVSFFSPTVADTRIDAIMTSFNDVRINPLARGG
jgi:hypothetical protein